MHYISTLHYVKRGACVALSTDLCKTQNHACMHCISLKKDVSVGYTLLSSTCKGTRLHSWEP